MNRYSWFSIMCLIKLILFIFHLKSDTCDYSHISSQNAVFMSWGQAHLLRPFSDKNVQYFQNSKKSQNFENFPKLKRKFPIFHFFFLILKILTFLYIFFQISKILKIWNSIEFFYKKLNILENLEKFRNLSEKLENFGILKILKNIELFWPKKGL